MKGMIGYWVGKKQPPSVRATQFKVGHPPYRGMLGKKHSQEAKEKMSIAHRGKVLSEEHKQKISDSERGRTLSIKHLKKLKKYQFQSGKNHWNWKGGITPSMNKLRNSNRYQQWRKKVYVRDNYCCVFCRKKGGWNKKLKRRILLEADHIKPWAFYPKLRFVVSNGRTLCKECHRSLPIQR